MSTGTEETLFEDFVELVTALAECSGHKERSSMISRFIHDGHNGSLHGDTYLILKLLLPKSAHRTFNIKDKQLINYFSEIFDCSKDDMMKNLEQGDVAMVLYDSFRASTRVQPLKKSKLLLKQVDDFLEELSNVRGDDARIKLLSKYAKQCTSDDFLVLSRLIKKDLRINAGAKQILDALGPDAYAAFQASNDLERVVAKVRDAGAGGKPHKLIRRNLSISVKLMTPVKPMLAEPGRSAEAAIAKGSTSGGLIVEIKYDGERVQVHKEGNNFAYFSRSLKPVQANKVEHLKEFIPKAFPAAADLILDAEVLLLDTQTKKPLPFGSLGVHKRAAFKDAVVCLFVFDCIYINGRSLLMESMSKRREILEKNMTVIPDRVLLSEKHDVKTTAELNDLMSRVFAEGLEGLVLKPKGSVYEPGKRHWIKIKKDYLGEGAMADSADLIVLGAYFGTGNKGGLMSVFLMGAYDPSTQQFCTVTKCGNGFDDRTLARLQKQLKMIKISRDPSRVPAWLDVARGMVPDFVTADPKKAPVWEIVGAEFSRAGTHTAGAAAAQDDLGSGGISIRFPRVTRQRPDKTWREATDVPRLEDLFKASRSQSDWASKLHAISSTTGSVIAASIGQISPRGSKRASPATSSSTAAASAAAPKGNAETQDSWTTNRKTIESSQKPRLVRVRDSMDFSHLRPLLEGFVIKVPKAVAESSEFDRLHRRLVCCGAFVTGDNLRQTDKTITHVIVNSEAHPTSPAGNAIPLTVEWLEKSINEAKLQPLPSFEP